MSPSTLQLDRDVPRLSGTAHSSLHNLALVKENDFSDTSKRNAPEHYVDPLALIIVRAGLVEVLSRPFHVCTLCKEDFDLCGRSRLMNVYCSGQLRDRAAFAMMDVMDMDTLAVGCCQATQTLPGLRV